MKQPFRFLATSILGLLALSSTALAQTSAFGSGALTTSDPTFTRPGQTTGLYYYDVYQLTVTATGAYTFELSSLNTAGVPSNALDTFLYVYANAFDPAAPTGFIASNDDFSGALTLLPGPFTAQGYTATSTGFTGAQPGSRSAGLSLTAGTPYFLVVTSFQRTTSVSTTSAGQATGNYVFGIGGGPGNVVLVPEPATTALLIGGVGVLALGVWRKRKSA